MVTKKIEDTKDKDVKKPEPGCQESGVNVSDAKIKRSAAVPDCNCDGTTKQIYDVT